MVGCKFLISKVGITTLVNVLPSRVSPNFSFTIQWRYFPSYLGPLNMFSIEPNMFLQKKKKLYLSVKYNSSKIIVCSFFQALTSCVFAIECEERSIQLLKLLILWENFRAVVEIEGLDILSSKDRTIICIWSSQHGCY